MEAVDVVCLASWNADLISQVPRPIARGETLLATQFEIGPGGKGSNAAVAAAREEGVQRIVAQELRGSLRALFVGRGERAHRATVKAAHHRDDAGATGRKARKFDRGFDRFRARVGEENAIRAIRRDRDQFFFHRRALVVVKNFGERDQRTRLFRDGIGDRGIRVRGKRPHAEAPALVVARQADLVVRGGQIVRHAHGFNDWGGSFDCG